MCMGKCQTVDIKMKEFCYINNKIIKAVYDDKRPKNPNMCSAAQYCSQALLWLDTRIIMAQRKGTKTEKNNNKQ